MTTFIPRLARITSGRSGARRHARRIGAASAAKVNVDAIARLLPEVRRRLAIGRSFSDAALLAGLVAIARQPSHEARWRAAETSTLGQHLAGHGKDPHRALVTLLALLPTPTL